MGSITKFAALNTKIRVFEGQLLTQSDYKTLINSKSLDEVIEYLKNSTFYGSILGDISSDDIQLIENEFHTFLVKRYEQIYKFVHMEYRKIFKTLMMRYEINALKEYIRRLNSGQDISQLYKMQTLSDAHSSVEYKKLSQATSLNDFIEKLEGTEYFQLLKYSVDLENQVFYMAMNLQIYYFKKLKREMQKVLGNERRGNVLEILGKNSDLLNIQWIYRGKKFYNVSSEELLNYVLLTGYYFNYEELKEFCYTRSLDALVEKFKQTEYGFLFIGDESFELLMERNVEKYIYKLFKKLSNNSYMDVDKSIAYMHELEYEMRDIFSIMEAVRYGFKASDIKEFLVIELEGRE